MRDVLSTLGAAIIGALVAGLALTGASSAGEQPSTGHSAHHDSADYNTAGRWPGDAPTICLADHTGGFPVREAAAEFDGLVELVVDADCAGHRHVVDVETVNLPDQGWSGWWRSKRDDAGMYEAGQIRLNLAQAFRMDPHGWRMVLVHELGHALGLGHTYEADSVMHPLDYGRYDGLTDTDREQLAELYGTGDET